MAKKAIIRQFRRVMKIKKLMSDDVIIGELGARFGRVLTTRATLPVASHCNVEERHGIRSILWAALGFTIIICLVMGGYLLPS